MKIIYLILLTFSFSIFSSFNTESCNYAESNMTYVIAQTKKALNQNELSKVKHFAYRAINAIEKSKDKFKDCNCDYASDTVKEGNQNLIMATQVTSLSEAKSFLEKALNNSLKSAEYLVEHGSHKKSKYGDNVLAMNTKLEKENAFGKLLDCKSVYTIVDESLLKYEASLNKIVNSVDCREARAYANKVYSHCEQQLLKPNLTEGKKYYNLRTKEITAEALKAIGDCEAK